MLKKAKTYQEVYQSFSWQVPEYYNIGVDICDKHTAVKNRTALIYESEDGRVDTYTFDDFIKLSNQFGMGFTHRLYRYFVVKDRADYKIICNF